MWPTMCCIACNKWLVICQGLGEVTSILADTKHNWQPVPAAVLCFTRSVGRPRFELSKDQLEYFAEYELTCPDIAEALGVSSSTIKRRLREFLNISIRATLTDISDADLDGVVRNIQADFPMQVLGTPQMIPQKFKVGSCQSAQT